MIEISEEAKRQIIKIQSKNPGKYFRLVLEGDGCAGPYLGLTLDEADPGEKTVDIDGVKILISGPVEEYIEVSHIKIFENQIQR